MYSGVTNNPECAAAIRRRQEAQAAERVASRLSSPPRPGITSFEVCVLGVVGGLLAEALFKSKTPRVPAPEVSPEEAALSFARNSADDLLATCSDSQQTLEGFGTENLANFIMMVNGVRQSGHTDRAIHLELLRSVATTTKPEPEALLTAQLSGLLYDPKSETPGYIFDSPFPLAAVAA